MNLSWLPYTIDYKPHFTNSFSLWKSSAAYTRAQEKIQRQFSYASCLQQSPLANTWKRLIVEYGCPMVTVCYCNKTFTSTVYVIRPYLAIVVFFKQPVLFLKVFLVFTFGRLYLGSLVFWKVCIFMQRPNLPHFCSRNIAWVVPEMYGLSIWPWIQKTYRFLLLRRYEIGILSCNVATLTALYILTWFRMDPGDRYWYCVLILIRR